MNWLADAGVRFGNPGGPALSALLIGGCAILIAVGVRQALRHKALRWRWALIGLRVLTALCALLFCLQPEWVTERVQQVQGRLAVLVDASRSMSVLEAGKSRAQLAFDTISAFRRESGQPFDLYVFGSEARPIQFAALDASALAREDDTRIGRAVERVSAELGDELGAIVLLSDGAELSPDFVPKRLAKLGVRVHALGFDTVSDLQDEGIVGLKADPVAFLRQQAEVEVSVASTRKNALPLTISLREDGRLISESTVELDAQGHGKAVLSFSPARIGRAVYSVSVPVADGDAVPQNNQRAFLVRVTREKLRVLLLCGAPTWDTRFLRAFLKADPAIDLITFFILRTNSDLAMASPEELSLIPFPTDELFREHLDSFDLVIFQDFNYGPYQVATYLPRIHDYVLRGGAFAMIGGSRSFGAGGYDHTSLAEILPVTMVAGVGALVEQEFVPTLVEDNARHPIVELVPDPTQNAKNWSELAPLVGANKLLGLQSGAQVLLTHPVEKDADGGPMPVLAVTTAGQGRVLALAVDSSWRWGIATAGLSGDASAYERFWDRALRWLARDPLLDPAHIDTDKESYGPASKLNAHLRLRDTRYMPLADRDLRLVVLDAAGEVQGEHAVNVDGDGAADVELAVPREPGAYQLAVRDPKADTTIAEQGFLVDAAGDELAHPASRPELMREIAAATAGSFHSMSSPPKLATLNKSRARSLGTEVTAPFLSPWFVALLVLAFAAEWALRRTVGLR